MKTRFHSHINDNNSLCVKRATQQEVMNDLSALTATPPSPYKRKTASFKAKSFRKIKRQTNKAFVDALLGVATLISEKAALTVQKPLIFGLCSNRGTIHHAIAHYIKKHNK